MVNLIMVLLVKNALMLFSKISQEHVLFSVQKNFTKFLLDNNANPALIAFTAYNVILILRLLVYHVILQPNIFI